MPDSRHLETTTRDLMGSSVAAVASLLELTAAGHPELLDLQLETLHDSRLRLALGRFAVSLDVPLEKLGRTLYRACLDLDRLEARRAAWRDPKRVLASPNVAALHHLCRARLARITTSTRRRRLEAISKKLELARELARSRAWIEAFIGPPLNVRQEAPHHAED